MKSTIKGFVVDMDDTLYSERDYYEQVLNLFGQQIGSIDRLPTWMSVYDQKRANSPNIFEDILSSTGDMRHQEELFRLYGSAPVNVELYEDAKTFLENNQNTKLGLLTNGLIMAQKNKIKSLGIGHYFDTIVFAREFGKEREKPEPFAFEAIIQQMKVPAGNLVFVGDNPKNDFISAKRLGGITVRIRRGLFADLPSNDSIDYEIKSFDQLKDVL